MTTARDADGLRCYLRSLTWRQRLGGAAYALQRFYDARKRHRTEELSLWRAAWRYLGL